MIRHYVLRFTKETAMNPIVRDLLFQWQWRPEVILVLAAMGVLYTVGWLRLRGRGRGRMANGWRLTSYWIGLISLALALLSSIDTFQSLLFGMHMIQHMLLIMVAAPLLMLGDPYPFLVWGLPVGARDAVQQAMAREGWLRRILRRLTPPWWCWAAYMFVLVAWHVPAAYDAALLNELVHDLEHLTFFWTAMLFWWHVTGAGPHVHPSFGYGARIVYVLLAIPPNEALGVVLTLARQPFYPYYQTVPRIWGLSVMDDQMFAGALMWSMGGMMYLIAALALLARMFDLDEKDAERKT